MRVYQQVEKPSLWLAEVKITKYQSNQRQDGEFNRAWKRSGTGSLVYQYWDQESGNQPFSYKFRLSYLKLVILCR